VSKPTVAQYTLSFRYLQTGVLANGSGSYDEALRHHVMVMYGNFPEDICSWESVLLLVFSHRGALTVGFRFGAATNTIRL